MPAAHPDIPDPAARRLPRLSVSPTAPPPSPGCAPCKSPLALLLLLPASSDNAPVDSHAGSTPHTSAVLPHTPPPPLPASAPPAPRSSRGCTSPPGTSLPSHSTPSTTAPALPPSAAATLPLALPDPLRSLPATSQSVPPSAPSDPDRTNPCHIPAPRRFFPPPPATTQSHQISLLLSLLPLPPLATRITLIPPPARSAATASPEIAVTGSGPAPEPVLPLASRTVLPGAHTLPTSLPAPASALPEMPASPSDPFAIPACLQKILSALRAPHDSGSPPASLSQCPPDLYSDAATPGIPPAAS